MNIQHIDTLDLKELEVYTSLHEPELFHLYEPKPGVFIAETPDVIGRALRSGYEPLSFLVEERVLESEVAKIPENCAHVPVFAAPLDVIKRITGFNLTRGMLCAMRRKEMPDFDEFIKNKKHLAVLEDIENPTNVGAIFRSAAALGADGAVLTSGCADPLYRRASRVSMGAVFMIPWMKTEDALFLEKLKKAGFTVVSMALDDRAVSIHDSMFDGLGKTAVVFGNEKTGISDSTLEKSNHVAKIPMQNGIDSLNVASAAAVAFYRFFDGK